MGQQEREREERKTKKQAGSKRGRAAHQGKFELTPAAIVQLLPLVTVLADAGGALRIGLTRDGGALALGIYVGDEYGNEYIKPDEDIHQAAEEIALAWLPNKMEEYGDTRERLYAGLHGSKLT